jgi:protein-ribulosamine 3-kinase
VKHATDLSDFACHRCAILTDGSYSVFAKYSDAPDARVQFETELSELRFLAKKAGVLTPTIVGILPAEYGMLMCQEALPVVARGPSQWKEIGRALARIHQVKSDQCGFPSDGFFGPLPQDNTSTREWASFYAERRLWPRLKEAVASGNLPATFAAQVESVIDRLPQFAGSEAVPSLLHGDAQQNNFISTAAGAYIIDPAVHFGNAEMDLAFLGYFQPVPDDVFDGYKEEMPIDPDFAKRCDLWRIHGYLAAVTVEGPVHLERLQGAMERYL